MIEFAIRIKILTQIQWMRHQTSNTAKIDLLISKDSKRYLGQGLREKWAPAIRVDLEIPGWYVSFPMSQRLSWYSGYY